MIVETYRGYAIDDVGYGSDSRYNVNFGGGWSGFSSVDAAKRGIDNFLPMPAPAPVEYFPSDENVTPAQVIAYELAHPNEPQPVYNPVTTDVYVPPPVAPPYVPPPVAPPYVPPPLSPCTNDAAGLAGWFANTCTGRPSFSPTPSPSPLPQPSPTGKTFWDVFTVSGSDNKLWIILIAVVAFIFISKK